MKKIFFLFASLCLAMSMFAQNGLVYCPASLTSILNRMEKQHMIERKNLNGNRRSFHIFLTDYGMELSESIEKAFLSLEQEVFSGISNAEKEQFLKIFEKLYKNTTKEE